MDEPKIDPDFRAYAEKRGWRCYNEYLPAYTDEDGVEQEGFWSHLIMREELIEDEMHVFVMSFDPTEPLMTGETRELFFDLADAGWQTYTERLPA